MIAFIEYVTPVIASIGMVGGSLGILHHMLAAFKDQGQRIARLEKTVGVLRRRTHKLRGKMTVFALRSGLPELTWSGDEQVPDDSTEEDEAW